MDQEICLLLGQTHLLLVLFCVLSGFSVLGVVAHPTGPALPPTPLGVGGWGRPIFILKFSFTLRESYIFLNLSAMY